MMIPGNPTTIALVHNENDVGINPSNELKLAATNDAIIKANGAAIYLKMDLFFAQLSKKTNTRISVLNSKTISVPGRPRIK